MAAKMSGRDWLDFHVDGRSLADQLGLSDDGPVIGFLGWMATSEFASEQDERVLLDQLLLDEQSRLASHRVMLYVCPECGFDIGCGAITAIVEDSDGTVVWRDFGFEIDPQPDEDAESVSHVGFDNVGPFRFNTVQYREAILNPPAKETAP